MGLLAGVSEQSMNQTSLINAVNDMAQRHPVFMVLSAIVLLAIFGYPAKLILRLFWQLLWVVVFGCFWFFFTVFEWIAQLRPWRKKAR